MAGFSLLGWGNEQAQVKLHTSATGFLLDTYLVLCQREVSANIILAHALDYAKAEIKLHTLLLDSHQPNEGPDTPWLPTGGYFWLTLWSNESSHRPTKLQLVLSCLSSPLGDYPIFVWSPEATAKDEFSSCVEKTLDVLIRCVEPDRVFSVFGQRSLVEVLAHAWTAKTGFHIEPEPFYIALLTYCTRGTFKPANETMPSAHNIRAASSLDLEAVAVLCKEFADASVYFPLTLERGRDEARWLIQKRQIWLYEVNSVVTSICAVTRHCEKTAVVTKVYTLPKWRRKRCAERLVRAVTSEMLTARNKEYVALYVGTQNDAQHVYDRVGFVGISGKDRPSDVEDALELGFRGTNRGYW